ncbi:chemotaxis protein MotA [Paenibacillus shirakamiensis]|uniref:Chemotaxis protein MotA n=1 Tax=Paenibacillus shirakamiensis TaxID=1265935 RepID=A0ABS4JJ58_9BACL|nr:flagellar motor protein [Paenibacillus shirakamiensis]MBP2001744.1 chemotaxis protein MotA [Paenibacillus shirakamiensis]
MDITTVLGILIGLLAIVGGFLWEGGEIHGLMQVTSALIVFGGTFAAVMVSFPPSKLRTIPRALGIAFSARKQNHLEMIEDIVNMAVTARRSGLLALERQVLDHEDPFLKEGIQLVVDGTDQHLVKQIMELEMDAVETRHQGFAKVFEAAGGYAPTMGIIGTVMGLIHVLGSLSDPSALGPAIALAFTATLYGVASANLIFLPIATKIKTRGEDEILHLEMLLFGILSVQNGDHPLLVRKKLESFTADRRTPRVEKDLSNSTEAVK